MRAADGPVPDDFVAAVVKVLAAWDWDQRPAGVVTLPSRTRPQLVESLGQRHRRDRPDAVPRRARLYQCRGRGPAGRQYNSAQRLAALWHELTVPGALGGEVAGLGGPVLLVDDRVETGWTMTVAAKLLREAGRRRGAAAGPRREQLTVGLRGFRYGPARWGGLSGRG